MKRIERIFTDFFLLLLLLTLGGCGNEEKQMEVPPGFVLEEGFELDLVAKEPLVQDPVTMSFDEDGRMWVVEMPGYMPDINGRGEKIPNGRIVILEDQNSDGQMDRRSIFLDSLVLPRAICVFEDGILFAEPPNLWWVERNGDLSGEKVLVDSVYALNGNVEHQPNGLMYGLDNWIYSAKSAARYRLQQGKWLKSETEFRGQWGLSQDRYGRIFFNSNGINLNVDQVPPSYASRNPNHRPEEAIGKVTPRDQRLFPIHPTLVNRGYQEGVLDSVGKVRNFTSACGPLVYQGENFPSEYHGNAFVCAPEANLIKRNIISEKEAHLSARQAWDGKEFLASTDELFRPASLANGPDGAMYIVDFHRGIIQHKTYMSVYLREESSAKGLDTITGMGRIYRVRHSKKSLSSPPKFSNLTSEKLVPYLNHENGAIRMLAQKILVKRGDAGIKQLLWELAKEESEMGKLHALWTMEGMDLLSVDELKIIAADGSPQVQATAMRISEIFVEKEPEKVFAFIHSLTKNRQPNTDLQAILSLGNLPKTDSVLFLLNELAARYPNDTLFQDALLSSLHEVEKNEQQKRKPDFSRGDVFSGRLTHGQELYLTLCATCHANDGKGLKGFAPPLYQSEYVNGPLERLAMVILHGMTGPVTVQGKAYQSPDIQSAMPGLAASLSDEEVAAIMCYVRYTFAEGVSMIGPMGVATFREASKDRKSLFEEAELLEISKLP